MEAHPTKPLRLNLEDLERANEDKEIIARARVLKRYSEKFPFGPDKRYPITSVRELPVMPIAFHLVWQHPCYQVLMSDGLYLGKNDSPFDFRLDYDTVKSLGGIIPDPDYDHSLDIRRRFNAIGLHPNNSSHGTNDNDREYDIDLVRDGLHPLQLIGSELTQYMESIRLFFSRSTVFVRPHSNDLWDEDL